MRFGSPLRCGGADNEIMNENEAMEQLKSVIVPLLRPYVRKIGIIGADFPVKSHSSGDLSVIVILRPEEDRPPLGLKWFRLEEKLNADLNRKVSLLTESQLSVPGRERAHREMYILYDEEEL